MQKRKIIALFLALAMALAFAMPAFAAETVEVTNQRGSITIIPPANHVLTANQFKAYPLYYVIRYHDVTSPATNPIKEYKFVYEASDEVKAFLLWVNAESAKPLSSRAPSLEGKTIADYGVTADPTANIALAAEQFRQWLQTYADTHDEADIIALSRVMLNAAIVPPFANSNIPADAAKVGNNVKFSNVKYGWYLVLGEALRDEIEGELNGGEHTKTVISRGMLVNVPFPTRNSEGKITGLTPDAELKIKAEAPSIDKTLKQDDGTWGKETDRSIGDTIEFKVESFVPHTTGYTAYTFKLYDTLSKGLTYNNDIAVKLVVDGTDVAYNGGFVKVVEATGKHTNPLETIAGANVFPQTDGSTLLVLAFNPINFLTLPIGADIIITYSATLNEDAEIGSFGNPNTAKLEYARDPRVDGDCDTAFTPEDGTKVYTFDINVEKVDGVNDAVKLADAEFRLKKADDTVLWFNAPKAGNVYTLCEVQAAGTGKTQTLVSDSNGVIKLDGLDAGTYLLEETKAPTGYNLLPADITVVISHSGAGNYNVKVDDTVVAKVVVANLTGGILPGTGGSGTYIFFGVGIGLAVLLAAAFVIYKRKRTLGMLSA